MGVYLDNWYSKPELFTAVDWEEEEEKAEQNLLDTYYKVVTIKKHGVVSL